MSASDKKKLRKEERQAQLTQRQQAEQKEAKSLKVKTIAFISVVALVLCIGIGLIVYNWYSTSGITERSTVAVQIGDHKLSAAELNYFYIDRLNTLSQDWYSTYLLQQEGFQPSVALDQQQYKDEAGKTWGDYFIDEAINEASGIYAMVDKANEEGYTMTDDEKASIETTLTTLKTQAKTNGFSSLNDYLQAMYGNGAQEKSFRTYLENVTLAQSYYNHHVDGLTYSDEKIAEKDKETPGAFSKFDFTYYTLAADDFMEHSDEEEHDHTDEDKAAALTKAEEIAKELVASGATNKEELDAAIANLEMYKTETEEPTSEETTTEETATEETTPAEDATEPTIEVETEDAEEDGEAAVEDEESITVPTAIERESYEYDYIPVAIGKWLAAEGTETGKVAYIPYYATDEEGEETDQQEGFYVVIKSGEDKQEQKLLTVRHILKEFEGGTEDEETGETVYSDAEKKAAQDKILELKKQYEDGEKGEDAFAKLAKEHSDDNAEDGGLYEDVYPGQMVANFDKWIFDEGRKEGDVAEVETEYGWHLIYFVKKQDKTYREYLITETLRAEEAEEWFTGLQDSYKASAQVKNTSYQSQSIILSK